MAQRIAAIGIAALLLAIAGRALQQHQAFTHMLITGEIRR